ncbi:MAG TPA: efflux RND transporter periplasmic adaptor subunit [Pirellulales bacterium]|nr:efflux RND transporter periplasmic adaptor subunit [Pirellulales bacterium]
MKTSTPATRHAFRTARWISLAAFALARLTAPAGAHDEHEALPSKGAAVYKNMVLLTPQAEKAIGLKKAKVELDTWREEIVVNANVDVPCTRHAYAASLVTGRIEELLARPGDEVRQGQVLARVKSLELETLESQLLQASAAHDLAARVLDQRETLFASRALPEKDLFMARATHREKTAELALVTAKLRAVGLSSDTLAEVLRTKKPVGSLPIVSPIDGAVSLADARVGQTVEPVDHVFHLVDRSALAIVGEVLESDVWRVREGMPAKIVLASFPEAPLVDKIEHVGLKLNAQERTMHARVEMANPDGRIRPGMFGRMHIEVARKPEAVVCPADALIFHAGARYVLREQGRNHGKYVLTRVSVGARDDGRVEVIEGLFPGQRVITTGTIELTALLNDAFTIADAQAKARLDAGRAVVSSSGGQPATGGRQVIIVPGRVEAATSRKQFAASTVAGRLANILVERGARVRRGDVLAEIDSLQLRNLQLDLLSARVRLELTRQQLDRLKMLTEERLVNRTRIWELEADERSLQNKLATLASQLALMGLEANEIDRLNGIDLERADVYEQITTLLPVRAPADGWVVDFELGLGEVVHPQERLFELQDLSRVWVQAYVREGDAGRVRQGQAVTVTVAGDPSFRAEGTIVRTSPEVSTIDRVLAVWAELDNSQLRLREGMLATIALQVDETMQEASNTAARRHR